MTVGEKPGGCLELTFRHNGCGFAPASVMELAGEGHFGQAGHRESAAPIGGKRGLEPVTGGARS
jgi:signal transduction histidine kinase